MLIAGVLLAVVAVAQGSQAWVSWREQAQAPVTAKPGDLISVMLVNGQIYYGNYVEGNSHYVRIKDVYYVQSQVDPATNQPNNRVVSRSKADWHAPQWMAVSLDKVLMLEAVSPQSPLAQLIQKDKALSPAPVTPAP